MGGSDPNEGGVGRLLPSDRVHWSVTSRRCGQHIHTRAHTHTEEVDLKVLTAWVASENVSSGLVVQEDEQGVGEGAEPPGWPAGQQTRGIPGSYPSHLVLTTSRRKSERKAAFVIYHETWLLASNA